ncbi:MAG: beta-galactosidase trimerization domain-containing protein [Anaerolineae bacterium]
MITEKMNSEMGPRKFQRINERNKWYADSRIGFLIEYPIGSAEQLVELIQRGHVDFITCPCDYFGPMLYPTKVPATQPLPEMKRDYIALYRDVARQQGIHFLAGNYGSNNYPALAAHPDWAERQPDGTPYLPGRQSRPGAVPHNVCINSPYAEELMIPRFQEVWDAYHPDGYWFDCDNWYIHLCYCDTCRRMFKEQYGLDLPTERTDPNWPLFTAFRRHSFDTYINKIGSFIHGLDPKVAYVTNWAYTFLQPEPTTDLVDFLSSDIGSVRRVEMVSYLAHYLDAEPLPWDAMLSTWLNQGERHEPSYEFAPTKSHEYYAQQYAVVGAHGGRAHLWANTTRNRDDYIAPADIDLTESLSGFLRARDEVFRDTFPIRRVAILHSASTFYADGNGLYGHTDAQERILGASIVLRQCHIPYQILNEQYLQEHLDEYRIVILSQQTQLPAEFLTVLREWVRRGGTVIATGLTANRIGRDGKRRFLMADVLGLELADDAPINPGFIRLENPLIHAALKTDFYRVQMLKAEILVALQKDKNPWDTEPLALPAVTINKFGEGQGIYVAADLFTLYFNYQYPALGRLLAGLVTQADPAAQVVTDAPPCVTVTLRGKADDLVVQLVNEGTDWDMGVFSNYGGAFYVDKVPKLGAFTIKVHCPAVPGRIHAVPEIPDIRWHWDGESAVVEVPGIHIHQAFVLEDALLRNDA